LHITFGFSQPNLDGNWAWADIKFFDSYFRLGVGAHSYDPKVGGDTESRTVFEVEAGEDQGEGKIEEWLPVARSVAGGDIDTEDESDYDAIDWSDAEPTAFYTERAFGGSTGSIWTSSNRLVLRRARGSFDGPFPVFGMIAGERIPLSAEQIAWLNKETLSLANRPEPEIKKVILAMLEADRSGTEPPMDIAGFMRTQSAYDGSRVEAATNTPDSCDQCGRDLGEVGYFFDGCTIENLMWSWMCPPCFFGLGCGVGNGFGQLYLQEQRQTFSILGI
jgi:hypothetical protein